MESKGVVFIQRCSWSFSFYFWAQLCLLSFVLEKWFPWLFLATALHEGAHFLLMKQMKVPITRIRFSPGGILLRHSTLLPLKKEAMILLAGPLANLLTSAVLFSFSPIGAQIQAAVGLYQLLPIQGLDGGSLCRLACSEIWTQNQTETFCRVLSKACCLGIFLLAIYAYIRNLCNVWLPLITVGLVIMDEK